jgi:hypothetical protein
MTNNIDTDERGKREFQPLPPKCGFCKKAIENPLTSVMLRVWSRHAGMYLHEGPFHAECGKLRDEQIKKEST